MADGIQFTVVCNSKLHTVIVQYLAGELATKRTGRVTKVTAIQADIRTDISDSEVSQACDELLQQTDGLADRHVLHFLTCRIQS